MQLPVAGQEASVYRERVYCYELYHRWRCRWDDTLGYSLSGEIDKGGHRLIRSDAKPDFLVHVPGRDPAQNLLVVEVKPRNGSLKGIKKDLETLTTFRRNLGEQNYYAAYLWIYCLEEKRWRRRRERIKAAVQGDQKVDLTCITPMIHSEAFSAAQAVSWND